MPPPMAKIAADLRPSADGSAHIWWPAMAKLQAASVPIAIGSCATGQTDDTIRYDTIRYFNVRSKADISQLNLPHGTDN